MKLGEIRIGETNWYYDLQLRWLRNPSTSRTVDCDDISSTADLGRVVALISTDGIDDSDLSGFIMGLDLACEIVFDSPLSEVFSTSSSRASWEHGTFG